MVDTTTVTDGADSHDNQSGDVAGAGRYIDRAAVTAAIGAGLQTPPVGVVLLELLIEPVVEAEQVGGPGDQSSIERAIDARLREETDPDDLILVTGFHRLAVIRAAMSAPAEAEGLAYRLQGRLSGPIAFGEDGEALCQVAIGVAVSRRGDDGADLMRYAEHALGDARMLGGDMVVAFEDGDRDLLLP